MKIVAVDFDGFLTKKDIYPEIGDLNLDRIKALITFRKHGNKLILWTCRCGEYLDTAVKILKDNGLEFDAINDNIQEHIDKFNNNSRKVFADYYLDDKNASDIFLDII